MKNTFNIFEPCKAKDTNKSNNNKNKLLACLKQYRLNKTNNNKNKTEKKKYYTLYSIILSNH